MNATSFHISYTDTKAHISLSHALIGKLLNRAPFSELVILCIGTDRSTGDALGPLVGSKLRGISSPWVQIYGHLDEPIHAINLADTIEIIQQSHPRACLIAIDACLGRLRNVGLINIIDGPLKPGAGVNKELPEVGDLHITGIVNVGGFMEYLVLQNTRLSVVMQMSEIIANALIHAIEKISLTTEKNKTGVTHY